ncbi:MAG: phosphodiesterase [Dongiaceae bacterium]
MLIAQITDLHILADEGPLMGQVDSAGCLRRAVATLVALDPHPDVILATGDLVDGGSPAEYAHLRRILAPLRAPLFVVPGNHDSRAPLRAAFADDGYLPAAGDFLHYTVEDWPLRLIGLDSTVPGHPGGSLCGERLDWLAARLDEQPQRPTLLFMHHPPFQTGIGHMDGMALAEPGRLAALLARHPQVERVLAGHVHRAIHGRVGGTPASVAPSTAHQLTLALRPDEEPSFSLEPPGFHLHLWTAEGGIATHTALTDSFPGPFHFG